MILPAETDRHVRHGGRPFFGDHRRHEVAVARMANRGSEQVREGQLAVTL